ncbi:TonB-dependent receptor [Bacteroides sp. GD17]|uniref:SusC/RagA family TonB-linked outer membrane protein n=1 Tax=Bacteroides sp. GD17 TaxID=3139826 RepID=UPI0025FB527A|nr:TonB-dependent receptor [uncultured Bacteroides sp.]
MSNQMKNMRNALLFILVAMISLSVSAQNVTVKGTVTDKTGETVIGASVVEKGNTSNGTITDIDGNFTLSVPANATLIFSYVGMTTQEAAVKGQKVINVVLADDAQALEEVVVIGYGAVKRKDLTGSVATVNSETLAAVPVANATEALTGKMAGVQITTTEGSPDAEMKIRVRGGGSITGDNTPLFIVDGFPVESISDIPASDIEDMTVLKDASSTAIYGSRGANGVILVTTKSGKEGKVNVNYNAYYSWKKIAKTLDVLSPKDYAKWQYELALLKDANDLSSYEKFFGKYQDMDMYDNIPYNDWQDLTFGRTGETFNHNLSITGGSEKIRYAFSYSHMNDKAIMENSTFKRDNFSLKLNTKPVKNVTVDFSARYSDTDIIGGGATDATGGTYDTDRRLKYSVIYTPIPLSNLDSSAGSDDDDLGNLYHPLTSLYDNDRKQERKTLNMAGSFGWEIFKNFKIKTEVGYDDYRNNDQRFWGLTTYYIKNVPSATNQGKPAIQLANTSRHKFRNTNTISYDFSKLFKGDKHHLNAMIGHEWIITKSSKLTNIVHGFPEGFTSEQAWKLTSMGTPYSVDNYLDPDDKLLSYFGRVNYDFESKYLLSATFRADGSSKFASGNQWGYFPSAAVAWRVSSEPFMEGTKNWLDDLKLRLSYGTAGNNNIPSGQMVQTYQNSTTSWINGFTNYWAPSKTMANPDLKWETTITRNIGLDFTVLGGKLNGTVEAYLNTTKDLLIQFPVGGTGYDNQYRNMGKTENKGLEATINWTAIDKKDFGLSFSANIGFNKNKIKDLGIMNDFGQATEWASTEIGYDYWIAKGGSVGKMYGYRSDGRYEVSDFTGYDEASKSWILKEGVADASSVVGKLRPGSMKLKNLNGSEDNIVDANDREIIGDANPVHTGGFSINARAYGFDLSANFNWSVGNDVYNANKIEFTQTGKYQYRNMISDMADGKRWTNLNEDGTLCNDPAKLAAMNANTTMWSPMTDRMVFSDWAVEDGSFLRLNTLTLGYTIPKAITNKARIQNLRFYVTAYNVFCLTSYSGYDPEVSAMRKTNLTPGVDYSAYPKSRQFVVGVNLNF